MSHKLFDDDSSDEDNNEQLSINKSYAENYEKWRKKEDYQKLKDKYGVKDLDSESDSEESDDEEFVEPDNPEFDMDFFKCLAAIRTNHASLAEGKKFFRDSYQPKVKKKNMSEKPLTVIEYEKKLLVERGGKCDDEDDLAKPGFSGVVKNNELFKKKEEKFKFEDNLSDDEEGDLFTKIEQPSEDEDEEEEENEAIAFLQGKKKELKNKSDEELLSGLKKDMHTNMSKKDKFLMDYFVNKRYLEEEEEDAERAPNHRILDIEDLEDDEETFNKMEEFETKYRFRFEEPDEEFIRRYPRVTEESVRLTDNKRKEDREKKKERIKEEEERRRQEVLRLKAFKKQEIEERIEKLKEAAGLGENEMTFTNFNLDEDFDPVKHDAEMSKMFNEDYYIGEDGEEKPTYEDEELKKEIEAEYEKLKEVDSITEGQFRYGKVFANSYGLTTKEILYAKDTELNRWYSINGVLKYREDDKEELKLQKNYSHRAKLDHVKQKIFPSLYSEKIEEHWEAEEEKKRKKNLKKKERKLKKRTLKNGSEDAVVEKDKDEEEQEENKKVEERLQDTSEERRKEETTSTKKRKKKGNKSVTETGATEVEKETENSLNEINATEIKSKKRKRNKVSKDNNEIENETQDVETKSKKRKKDKDINVENEKIFANENCSVDGKDMKINNDEKLLKKENGNEKKKKKKLKTKKGDFKSSKNSNISKEKMEKRNQLSEISDARLAAYGQNPKKLKKLLKYSEKYN